MGWDKKEIDNRMVASFMMSVYLFGKTTKGSAKALVKDTFRYVQRKRY